jgi:HSP20 family protein
MNIIKRTNYPVLFDEFFNDFFNVQTMNIPPHNVMELENDFQIEFSVPGSNKKDFEIELEKDNLKISKKKEVSNSSNHYSNKNLITIFFKNHFIYLIQLIKVT